MKKYCFGIDVGGTTIKIGLFQTDGALLEKWEIPTRTENAGRQIIPDAAKSVLAKIKEKNLEKEEIAGVGIDVPGPVDDKGIVYRAVNLYWGKKDLVKELGELIDLPVKAGNDANIAALGEMWQGAAKGSENLIMITLGTGVGGGIIVNGKIIAGVHGAAGEVGHANVEPAEMEHCNCGNSGCLEQMTSATGIVRLAKKALLSTAEPSILRNTEVTAKAVFDAKKEGDKLASAIVEQFAEYLGNALAIFTSVLDPERIVIGGGVSKAGQVLIDVITPYYRRDAFPACKNIPIVLAQLGNDAGIYGAARLVLDE